MNESLFSLLVLSLSNAALMALNLLPQSSGDAGYSIEDAQHNIDLLVMLQEKTKGNLSREELSLLETVLYDLRMKYLEAKKGHS